MTSKQFFLKSLSIALLLILVIVAANYRMDPFGIHGFRSESLIPYSSERLGKFLYSYNYIPANFDGIILGPSLSDTLDTKKIQAYKIYNASLNGGNASELRLIFDNIADHDTKISFVVLCLDPYMTKDYGPKTNDMDPAKYWGSLGSPDLGKYYINQWMVKNGRKKNYINDYGYNDYIIATNSGRGAESEDQERTKPRAVADPRALQDLKHIVDRAHAEQIRVFAYYYPALQTDYADKELDYLEFKRQVSDYFAPSDCVWDFNDEEYQDLKTQAEFICDGAHLSYQGSDYVLRVIERKLNQNLQGCR